MLRSRPAGAPICLAPGGSTLREWNLGQAISKDGGSMSAKILGSDSELNMWTPENMQGVIILQTPEKLRDPEVLKKMLEAEE
jgi:hypothetical protein